MLKRVFLSMALLTAVAAGASRQSGLLERHVAGSFVRALQFSQKLRICNVYPHQEALDIYLGKDKLTDDPMKYKSCKEFQPNVKVGDKVIFKNGDADVGTFTVSDLPQNDAVLVLAITRHDTTSTTVAFESHIFANIMSPQVAVIDAYRGVAKATPRIHDQESADKDRNEELRYDSVVAVNPGRYQVSLVSSAGEERASQDLVALSNECYIVLRCGVEAAKGEQFPQELIVFPQSDPSTLKKSAASRTALGLGLAAGLAGLAML